MRRFLQSLLVVAACLCIHSGWVRADSWPLPQQEVFLSRGETSRLTVIPRELESQLDYFSDRVDGQEPGEGGVETSPGPLGILERRAADGSWREVWRAELVNDVAPVSAMVADDARHVVTFDNWHFLGFGDSVIVIYGQDGGLIRSFGLNDFVSEEHIQSLPRTVSSIDWAWGYALIDGDRALLLRIREPAASSSDDRERHTAFRIDLETGNIEPYRNGTVWGLGAASVLAIGGIAVFLQILRRRSRSGKGKDDLESA